MVKKEDHNCSNSAIENLQPTLHEWLKYNHLKLAGGQENEQGK